jgi:hypothetical protein
MEATWTTASIRPKRSFASAASAVLRAGGPAAMCVLFRLLPLPGDKMTYVKQVEGLDTRPTLLWFLERDPRDCWNVFTGLDAEVAAAVPGARVELVAPSVPTLPGAGAYADRLC